MFRGGSGDEGLDGKRILPTRGVLADVAFIGRHAKLQKVQSLRHPN